MAEPFVAEIKIFAGNFAPRGWAFCDGQLLAVSQNDALFSLVGTIYGGDGRTTFGLPDLRGRVPIHAGNGPGLPDYRLGQKGGQESVFLTTPQLPSHNHLAKIQVQTGIGGESSPNGQFLSSTNNRYAEEGTEGAILCENFDSGNTGGSRSHSNLQPFLCVNFIIALFGIYPSRN